MIDIEQYVLKFVQLGIAEQSEIMHRFATHQYEKGQIMLPYGKIAKQLFFVEKGIVRTFGIDDKGKEATYAFYKEGDFVTVAHSFFYQQPSKYIVETLESTVCSVLSYAQLNELLEKFPDLEKFKSQRLLQFLAEASERIMQLQFYSAQQRYELLLEKFPEIFQRINLGYIANYLGIAQATLSRIRAQY